MASGGAGEFPGERCGGLELTMCIAPPPFSLSLSQAGSIESTAVHRAAVCGHSEVVQTLLKHSADPALQDADGRTALHKAIEGGHPRIARLIVGASTTTTGAARSGGGGGGGGSGGSGGSGSRGSTILGLRDKRGATAAAMAAKKWADKMDNPPVADFVRALRPPPELVEPPAISPAATSGGHDRG